MSDQQHPGRGDFWRSRWSDRCWRVSRVSSGVVGGEPRVLIYSASGEPRHYSVTIFLRMHCQMFRNGEVRVFHGKR